MKKNIFCAAIFFALTATIFFCGCAKKKIPPPAAAPVLVAKSFATNVPVQIQPPPVGHVTPISTVTIHSQIGGILQQVDFKEGSEVKSNQLLFTIDPRPTQSALEQARANLQRDAAQLENAKIEFDREKKLFTQKLISQDEYDTSNASFDSLKGTVAADKSAITNQMLNLEFTEIRAPFDGVTGALQKHEGDVVKAPDDVLETINQIHPIYIEFAVPERYLPEIKKQWRAGPLKMQASFENMSGSPPEGELTFINNTVDESTGTIDLKGTFPNEHSRLWPGQFVHVKLTLSELTNAIVVPTQAVQTGQNGEFIYVVKADQTVEERPVTIGIAYGGETVIEKGLKAGETVVTDGQLRLEPNVKVSIKTNEEGRMQNAETNSMQNAE
jgi:multidrug efflux system membrane fusion protein